MSGNGRGRWAWRLAWVSVLVVAAWLRAAGLFRGLDSDYVFHPDEPKQVLALNEDLRGHYVWYRGNWFYDGYPYGLNHLDEWLLRPVLVAAAAVRATLRPDVHARWIPDAGTLYTWARAMRLVYGLAVVALTYAVARRLRLSRAGAHLAMLAVAVAPVAVTVAHFATGDIGVDLFGLVVLLCLALDAEAGGGRAAYLGLAGLATGLAYACKYNGMLCGAAVAFYLGLLLVGGTRRWRALVLPVLTAAAGAAAGVLILTPGFFINFERTGRDMLINLVKIRDHRVHRTILELPFLARARMGVAENTLPTVRALGWGLVLLALGGMGASLTAAVRERFGRGGARRLTPHAAACAAVCAYPFAALAVSLATKLRVQPFHFSYLAMPLALAAALAWDRLRARPTRLPRLAAAAGAACLLLELALAARTEHFFWRREDTLHVARRIVDDLYREPPAAPRAVVRNVFLEDGGTAVFRNRDRRIVLPDGAFWGRAHQAPVPAVPSAVPGDWVFLNGPVYPRSSRMLAVPPEGIVDRHVVWHHDPGPLTLGVRSGSGPLRLAVRYGGADELLDLGPNRQTTVTLKPRAWREPGWPWAKAPARLVPLRLDAQLGDATVTLMDAPAELAHFRCFGGEAAAAADAPLPAGVSDADWLARLPAMRFVEGTAAATVDIDSRSRRPTARLPEGGTYLPCGRYTFACDVVPLVEPAELDISLEGDSGCPGFGIAGERWTVAGGPRRLIWSFAKPFAPHHCHLAVRARAGRVLIADWRLLPDAAAILADLHAWRDGGPRPGWLERLPAAAAAAGAPLDGPCAHVRFGDGVELTRWRLPATLASGACPTLRAEFGVAAKPPAELDRLSIFLHLLDAGGRQVYAANVALRQAWVVSDAGRDVVFPAPADLPPGRYSAFAGLYHARTLQRLPLDRPGLTRDERRHRRAFLGTVTGD